MQKTANASTSDSSPLPDDPEIRALIQRYQLKKHPEGGWYRKLYKCQDTVLPQSPALERYPPPTCHAAGTSILFLVTAGDHSAWHRLLSDETWYFHRGDALTLRTIRPTGDLQEVVLSGDPAEGDLQYTVRALQPLSAETRGRYTLVGCGQCPGFEYRDWQLLTREEFLREHPGLSHLAYLCSQ
ncbi:uncharacterized protein LOC129582377 [Paramacrobiotus metropolitanus]|uniref:uncharacterized protein LOC129582377 n=1 Tax=Paramacrobiotus metropolitanus TaxID=2943436 RepID=UPI0024456103|nr:uncharacterized protein LOC129582377 [Paramacrobiotus metropolitanus]